MAKGKKEPTITWTRFAEIQLVEVLNYWTERNGSTNYAEKLTDAVWERTQFLLENPEAAPKTDFPNTRKAAMGHFSIVYRNTDSGILIMAFWDNRQNPKKFYEQLLDIYAKNRES